MASLSCSLCWVILFIYAVAISSSILAKAHEQNKGDEEIRSVGRRFLLGFKETPKGSNVTFECSPSGPCVSCNSSEKRKDKYRCSETGYRIPFKCKEVKEHKKDGEETQNAQSNTDDDDEQVVVSAKPRNLRDDSSPAAKASKSQSYKTYRSCVPSADEEKVSVLGFEAFMLGLLLISGSAILLRKRQTVPMLGVSNGRSQSNSRADPVYDKEDENHMFICGLEASLLFFILVFWGFFPVFTAIFAFPQERAMLNKERAADMYRLSAYFLARTTSDLPLDFILPSLFLLVVYFMTGLRLSPYPFFLSMLTVFLCIIAAQGLGLAIGAILMDFKKATTLASVTVMTFMLAGGFFVKKVPMFIAWIRYISFNYHTYTV